jgi:N-acetylglucosamine-6-phosphate deacetylase
MPPIKTRDPGVAVIALNDNETYAGLIADGFHIDPELVRLVVKAKAPDKLFMVSDAAPCAGAITAKPYIMGGVRVTPQNGHCVNDDGTLAGAQKTLGECVPFAIKEIKLDPERVLRMASTIPADFLGLGKRFGRLLPNYTADIVGLDQSFAPSSVWQNGIKIV